ncbi:hypothetical protein [Persephonella sp.]|uniref:hypothetical protein n=1 Tax=Persephonella sp. TaxID=2060922 RepID=UPI0025CB852B|nr:hypothetical protein [Persephonella sp.]
MVVLIFLFVFGFTFSKELKIIFPSKNTVLIEGRQYIIKWEGDIEGKACISVLMGGKERGIINDCQTDFSEGRYIWKIPEGFVTGFGINIDKNVRIAIFKKENPEDIFYSDYFKVSGYEIKKIETKSPEEAIKLFFSSINKKDYDTAYNLLSKCKITVREDVETFSYLPPKPFIEWKRSMKKIRSVKILVIKDVSFYTDRECDGKKLLGIKTFRVDILLNNKKTTRFLDLVKGSDGNYRILGIGTGP